MSFREMQKRAAKALKRLDWISHRSQFDHWYRVTGNLEVDHYMSGHNGAVYINLEKWFIIRNTDDGVWLCHERYASEYLSIVNDQPESATIKLLKQRCRIRWQHRDSNKYVQQTLQLAVNDFVRRKDAQERIVKFTLEMAEKTGDVAYTLTDEELYKLEHNGKVQRKLAADWEPTKRPDPYRESEPEQDLVIHTDGSVTAPEPPPEDEEPLEDIKPVKEEWSPNTGHLKDEFGDDQPF